MPAGVEVFIEDGLATIGVPDKEQRRQVLNDILAHTPASLVEKLTRSGPFVQYRIPEGNAAAAGLLEESYIKDRFQSDRNDSGRAAALVAADPQAPANQWPGDYHTITPNVADLAYAAGRSTVGPVQDGDVNSGESTDQDATISGPLRPNKPVVDPDDVPGLPPFASETSAALQKRIRESTINPVDYAPDPLMPAEQRVPAAQGTIAAVVDRTPPAPLTEAPAGVGFTGEFPDTDQGTADETPLSPPVPNDTHVEKAVGDLDASDAPRILTPDDNDLPTEKWTIPDLKKYAKDHDIDLEGATKKDDILAKVLKKA